MAASVGDFNMADKGFHTYCRTAISKENRSPSFLAFGDHLYGKHTSSNSKKRCRGSPTGFTPYAASKRPAEEKSEPLSDFPKKSSWSNIENQKLSEWASHQRVHSRSFWNECAVKINKQFFRNRTGASCRLQYKRINEILPLAEPQEQMPVHEIHDACNSRDVECQTEPSIPVNLSSFSTLECEDMDTVLKPNKGKAPSATAEKLHDTARLLHEKQFQEPVNAFVDSLFENKVLKQCILKKLLFQIGEDARSLCERGKSYLHKKKFQNLKTFSWAEATEELINENTLLCQTLLACALPPKQFGNPISTEKLIPLLGFLYSSLMKARWKELSGAQRFISVALLEERVHQKVFDRLQPIGVCVSYMVTSDILTEISGHFQDEIIDSLKEGKKFRLVGDNVNFSVDVSHLRNSEGMKKHMEHWFGSAAIIQNITFDHLSGVTPSRILTDLLHDEFLLNEHDWNCLKKEYVILIMRVLSKHLSKFSKFKFLAPDVIHGKFTNQLKAANKVIPLPVLPKNEQKYADVVDVLEYYEQTVSDVYTKADIPVDNRTTVHIGGDQLTRERFSGAKRLRGLALAPSDRFDHLSPITFELFHLQMNFLTVMYKLLYNEKSTEPGTFGSEKIRLGRKRANGQDVKNNFNDCSELAISMTDAYIVEAACNYFGMDSTDSTPTRNIPGVSLEDMTPEQSQEWINSSIGDLVETMVWKDTKQHLQHEQPFQQVTVLMPNGTNQTIIFPIVNSSPSRSSTPADDGYERYAHNVLELGLLYKSISDAIKVPDRDRMIRILKYIMVTLKGHNNNSKYALEILRFLCHQLATLSERTAYESFYGLFVNTHGKVDTHIPADMKMEHLVRLVKESIRSVQSNKTEAALVKKTGAFSGVKTIGETYDKTTSVIVRQQKHKIPSSTQDEKLVINNLRRVKPFQVQPGRTIGTIPRLAKSPVCKLDLAHLKTWITEHQLLLNHEIGN